MDDAIREKIKIDHKNPKSSQSKSKSNQKSNNKRDVNWFRIIQIRDPFEWILSLFFYLLTHERAHLCFLL